VLFVDDSKATTVTAMEAAIKSCDRPVRLLAGGVFKGGDLAALVPLVREKVASIALFGASQEVFEAAFTGVVPIFHEPALRTAMTRLYAAARPGDVVLLSPATSSFDLYPNYKARGRDFQAVFADLPGPVRTGEGGAA
jgi:UDP-N-acetylmuramoylalanine--D-glutamate ligase